MGVISRLRRKVLIVVDDVVPSLKVIIINKKIIQKMIPGLGKVMKLEINKDTKNLEAEFELNGEKRPIKLAASYTLHGSSIKLTQVKADRPWVEAICKQFVLNKTITIPEWIVEALLK